MAGENLKEYGPVVGCEAWHFEAFCKVSTGLDSTEESWDPNQRNNFPHGQWTGTNVYPHAGLTDQ